jgi:hypothetical protein
MVFEIRWNARRPRIPDDKAIGVDLPCSVADRHRDRSQKGRTLEENVRYQLGIPHPEWYRKALRLLKQAEKFGRP